MLRDRVPRFNRFRVVTAQGDVFGGAMEADAQGIVLRRLGSDIRVGGSSALFTEVSPDSGAPVLVRWSEVEAIDGRRGSTTDTVLGVLEGAVVGFGLVLLLDLSNAFHMDSGLDLSNDWIWMGATAAGGIAGAAWKTGRWHQVWP